MFNFDIRKGQVVDILWNLKRINTCVTRLSAPLAAVVSEATSTSLTADAEKAVFLRRFGQTSVCRLRSWVLHTRLGLSEEIKNHLRINSVFSAWGVSKQ
jgi:hypothetical protein